MPETAARPDPNPRQRIAAVVLVAALVLAGAISASAAMFFSITRSQDFQWSGERLLLHHMDPWQIALAGNPGHLLIGTQNPNYLPELYVLLVPFGLISLQHANLLWAVCNVIFAAGSAVAAARFYGLRSPLWAAGIAGAMLSAAPTRTSISNGQQGLLIVALWSAALLLDQRACKLQRESSIAAPLLVGVSYLKYSFAPAAALLMLLCNGLGCLAAGLRRFAWSLLPPVAGLVLVWLWLLPPYTASRLLQLVTEPLSVAKSGYQPTSDPGQTLMDLLEFLLGGNPVARPRLTLICFAVAGTLTIAILLAAVSRLRRLGLLHSAAGTGYLTALTGIMSFALYKHHPYDEVVFLFAACYALRHRRQPLAIAALVLIADHWYLQRFIDALFAWSFTWAAVRLASFLLLLLCIFFTRPAADTVRSVPGLREMAA